MAFTLQSYVLPAGATPAGVLPSYVLPAGATPAGEMPEYVADPTLLSVDADLPNYITDPTLVPPGELPEYVTAPTAANPGMFRYMSGFTKAMSGVEGAIGTASKTMQVFGKSASAVPVAQKHLQSFRKTMTGVTGVYASMNKTLGATDPNAQPTFFKVMATSPTGTMSRQLQYFKRATTGVTGVTGTMTGRTMTLWQKSATGAIPASGAMLKQLILFGKVAQGVIATGSTWSTFSMHTERQALSQYTNFQFNSFCIFNGKMYGASDAGLFEITGATDNGAPIAALIAGGITDFGDSHLKTIDRVHVGYRTNGELTFTLITHDDGKKYDYLLPSSGAAGIYGRRVVTGRGLRARYYQWQIANVNGASLYLDSTELSIKPLSRRIGGSDA